MNDMQRVFEEAQQRIGKGWTQGKFARDKWGNGVDISSSYSCQWCLTGAIYASIELMPAGNLGADCTRLVQQILVEMGHLESVFDYNDDPSTTVEDIKLVLRKAQERAASME